MLPSALGDGLLPTQLSDETITQPPAFSAQAFGLRWCSDTPLVQFVPARFGTSDIKVKRVKNLIERSAGLAINNGFVYPDGTRFHFGDVVFDTFHGTLVTWWSPTAHVLPHAFYGTVTAIILAWRGLAPLHASAVELGGRAVVIAGPPGAGKSTLCAALVRKGGRLVSDDLSALIPTPAMGAPMLQPGRPAIRLATPGGHEGEKELHQPQMVDPGHPVEFGMLVILRANRLGDGPAEANEALQGQMFRPQWMRALPYSKERTLNLFRAAQRVAMIVVPSARDRPDLAPDQKAELVLAHFASSDARSSKP